MKKIQKEKMSESSKKMLSQKTNEDFNKVNPVPADFITSKLSNEKSKPMKILKKKK